MRKSCALLSLHAYGKHECEIPNSAYQTRADSSVHQIANDYVRNFAPAHHEGDVCCEHGHGNRRSSNPGPRSQLGYHLRVDIEPQRLPTAATMRQPPSIVWKSHAAASFQTLLPICCVFL